MPAFSRGSDDSYEALDGDNAGGLLILVDHASNFVPARIPRPRFAARAELERHIAYDIGAGPLARALAERFRAPAILTRFSRLIIDPNRGEDDPTLIMRLSDGAVVPGNRDLDAAERERRLESFPPPLPRRNRAADRYDARGRRAAGDPLRLIPTRRSGRATRAAVARRHLVGSRSAFRAPLIEKLAAEHGLRIGDNEPYLGALKNDTMYRHGTGRGLAHALLEVRNDLIETPAGVLEWADRLEPILRDILAEPDLHEVRHYGSLADDDALTEGDDDASAGQRHAHGA